MPRNARHFFTLNRARLRVNTWMSSTSNEAFAVQAQAVSCDLKFDPKKTNLNGGGQGIAAVFERM